jgi:radical SAM protein with 4Fe4S-binding SPASM domain
MIKKYGWIRRDLDGNYEVRGCPAATERICLTPSGEVLPCTKIHVSFGNVKYESLASIRQKMMRHREFSVTSEMCIAAEDRVFIEKRMKRCFNRKKTLISEAEFFQ